MRAICLLKQPNNWSCHVTAWANLFRLAGYDILIEDLWSRIGHSGELGVAEVIGVFGCYGIRVTAFDGQPCPDGCGVLGVDLGPHGHAFTWVGSKAINPKTLEVVDVKTLDVVGGMRLDKPELGWYN